MTNILMRTRRTACALLLCGAASFAHAWADKPVRFIVPAPAGGAMDAMARVLAEQLGKDIGQPVIVDNRPGAGGAIGMQAMLSAPADGHTLVVTASNVLVEIPHVMKPPYDPVRDVRPVAAIALVRNLLVSAPSLPAQDFAGLSAYLKATPGKYSYASHSAGTASHYAGLLLSQATGADLQHVPFAGAPPALAQVIGGNVTLLFDSLISSAPMLAAGKVRAYAIGGAARHPNLPQVPTFQELGRPELDYANWFGVVAASKMPDAEAERINRAVQKAVEVPAVRDRLTGLGFEMLPHQPPAALARAVRADFDRNLAIVRKFNIAP